MSLQLFLILLFAFSAIASLMTEAFKKLFSADGNITAFIISIVVGFLGTLVYCVFKDITLNLNWILQAVLLSISCSLTSQLGYDKVKQTITTIMTQRE